jgi:hypothetical protein
MRIPVTEVPTSRSTGLGLPAGGGGNPQRVRELSTDARAALGITCNLDDLGALLDDAHYLAAREDATYWNEDGQEIDPDDCVLVDIPLALKLRERRCPKDQTCSMSTWQGRQ